MSFLARLTLVLIAVLVPFVALRAESDIRTPPASPLPRINGPRVYGERPNHSFFYHLPVTGERPMIFAASGLPNGLVINAETGDITGATNERGAHPVRVTASNPRGRAEATVDLVIGDTVCLTPPLGWNSWNHFKRTVTEADVRAAADAMVSSGLIEHGWTYVNVDDCWQGDRSANGDIQGNPKFSDPKALGDYIHSKSLKFGLYSSPGPKTCAGFNASYQHEDQDARTYAGWGVDYIKYDLCSYRFIIDDHLRERLTPLVPEDRRSAFDAMSRELKDLDRTHPTPEQQARRKDLNAQYNEFLASIDQAQLKTIRLEEEQIPYRVFGQSLAKVPRDIVYSLCQYGRGDVSTWGASLSGNCWRTTGDINATWDRMTKIGFAQDPLAKAAGPGHWNDPDMLEVGNQGLNSDECYTHMTLWCMLSAPLLIGCDTTKMDPLTVSMFSNDEVLGVDQDALGAQGHRLKSNGALEVWVKPLADGTQAVALFNRGDQAAEVGASWNELSEGGKALEIRDLWRQKSVPVKPDGISMILPPHGAELLKISAQVVPPHI